MALIINGFEWDASKAQRNVRKHRITFDEATTAFDDVHARVIDDPDHSDCEDRFVLLGLSTKARVLVVCHCLRNPGAIIRIISARKATRPEETAYWRLRG